jgi:DNA-binding GntR family transcriptional regulator
MAGGVHPLRGLTLPRLPLSEEVAARLREEVMSGELRPGEFIRLESVAQRLGVSVTPVREALLLLRGEDVVRLIPRRGFVVAPLSRIDVEDLFLVQSQLAGQLAERAVGRMSADDLATLEGVNELLERAVGQQVPDQIEALEYQFHRAINIAADSRKLAYVLRSATQYLPRRFFMADAHWRRAVNRDHKAILEAFAGKDPGAARAAMEAHVLEGRELLIAHLDEIGFWSPEAGAVGEIRS